MTHFEAHHRFSGKPDAVVRVLADPDFYRSLVLPDLSLQEARSERVEDGTTSVLLRYEFTGNLHPLAKQLLGGERLTWAQAVRIDPAGRHGSLFFESEAKPDVLHGEATFTLTSAAQGAGAVTVRALVGDIVVALPVLGGLAERGIAAGIVARLDLEAEALCHRLGK